MHWAELGSLLFALTVVFMNMYPMQFKDGMYHEGNLRSNMFFFKIVVPPTDKFKSVYSLNCVTLAEESDIGRYNYANRSLYNFVEWSLSAIVVLPFNFFVYPYPSLACILTYCLGRLVYQLSYTKRGFGGHFVGFFIKLTSLLVLYGLILVPLYISFLWKL